jgi:hypothetical protein
MEAKMDDRQEEMKVQVSSFASQIIVNQEKVKAMFDACLEKMEENPGELQSVVVHHAVPRKRSWWR